MLIPKTKMIRNIIDKNNIVLINFNFTNQHIYKSYILFQLPNYAKVVANSFTYFNK